MDSDEERDSGSDWPKACKYQNQPYDESLEVPDAEEIASTYSPTPRVSHGAAKAKEALGLSTGQNKGGGDRLPCRGESPPMSDGGMSEDPSLDQYEDSTRGGIPGGGAGVMGGVMGPPMGGPGVGLGGAGKPGSGPQGKQQFQSDEDDEDSEDDDEDDDDDDDDDDEHPQIEGAYDPAEFENLSVTAEIKEMFQYITRYTPQAIELDNKLKPFIPDYIPAVGDIDAFIKIARPDGKPDTLGLTVLDEPCAKQSDPTVLDLQLRAISKQTTPKQLIVKSLQNAEKNPKHIENWIDNIRELHRSKPPPNVHYSKNMPDIDTLMQEWPPEFEQLLKEVSLPTAELDCDLGEYVEIICGILDIPVYKNSSQRNEKIQALHVLFTLFSEFKNSQHFRALAEDNKLDNALKEDDGADRFVL